MTEQETVGEIAQADDSRAQFKRESIDAAMQDVAAVYGTGVEDLDLSHFVDFLNQTCGVTMEDVLMGSKKVNILQMLHDLGLVSKDRLTLAGLMLFGKKPQNYLQARVVKCVAYSGNGASRASCREREEYGGTIRDMYKSTMQFILRNIRHERAGLASNSVGPMGIPEVALRELVANMFQHGDYFALSPWRVMVFADRVELSGPGALPGHMTVEMMKFGVSVARNPLISAFAAKDIPGLVHGAGVKRVLEAAPKVEFVSNGEDNSFTATIYRQGMDADPAPADDLISRHVNRPTPEGPVVVFNRPKTPSPSSYPARLLALIGEHPGISLTKLSELSGIPIKSIQRSKDRRLRGKIEFRGKPRSGGYYLKEQE